MSSSPAAEIIKAYRTTHARVVALAEKLADEQLRWRPTPSSLSIAFHVWHIARWTDHLQATFPGMTAELGRRLPPGVQIWEAEDLTTQWGFDAAQLGYAATGMTMPETIATGLMFPPKDTLLAYLQRAFAAVDRSLAAVDDQQFGEAEQPQPLTEGIWGASTVGDAILTHLIHDNRHLGMLECLAGIQTGDGSATV
jgi:DinB superfamily